jgi:WD40 repeat protein
LDNAKRALLVASINNLPAPSKASLPKERQILISGIRSNQWFTFVYDRANVPSVVEYLYGLTEAYLEWFIPKVGWQPYGVEHAMFQGSLNSFAFAEEAQIAVYNCGGCQIWDLAGRSPKKLAMLDGLPDPWRYYANYLWSIQAISPDGTVIFIADKNVVFAVNWKTQSLVWNQTQVQLGNLYQASHRTIAIGNHGKSLFIVESNSIQRWNSTDGRLVDVLMTNASGIKLMDTSPDGELLLAGFGDNSFAVWKTDRDAPEFRFTETNGASCAAISPDNQKIVVNGFGYRKLIIYDLQRSEREEFPLRTPLSSSAYALHWSPNGKRLAACINTYPASVLIYETTSWKPIAEWACGAIGTGCEFVFNKDGTLFQLMGGEFHSLDVSTLNSVGE